MRCWPLLQLDFGAYGLELLFHRLGIGLVHAVLDGLRRAFDKILGFLEAEPGDGPYLLDDLDLLVADCRKDDGKLGLLFHRRCGTRTGTRRGDCRWSCRGYAPLLLKELRKLCCLKHSQARKFIYDFSKISHFTLFR